MEEEEEEDDDRGKQTSTTHTLKQDRKGRARRQEEGEPIMLQSRAHKIQMYVKLEGFASSGRSNRASK